MSLKQEVLAAVEIAIEKMLEAKCDAIVLSVIESIKKAIPGQIDDAILATVQGQIQAIVKAELLKMAEKIDGQV